MEARGKCHTTAKFLSLTGSSNRARKMYTSLSYNQKNNNKSPRPDGSKPVLQPPGRLSPNSRSLPTRIFSDSTKAARQTESKAHLEASTLPSLGAASSIVARATKHMVQGRPSPFPTPQSRLSSSTAPGHQLKGVAQLRAEPGDASWSRGSSAASCPAQQCHYDSVS